MERRKNKHEEAINQSMKPYRKILYKWHLH